MNNVYIIHFIRFAILVLLQVTVFDNIQLHGLFNPFIYVYFILMLPINTVTWFLLLLAFGAGLTIDIFQNTLGIHASACTLLAFIRPIWLRGILRKERDMGQNVSIKKMDFLSFVAYAGFLLLIFHLLLFGIESGQISDFVNILLKTIINTFITLIFVLIFRHTFK